MRISDWSSDVCSSDLPAPARKDRAWSSCPLCQCGAPDLSGRGPRQFRHEGDLLRDLVACQPLPAVRLDRCFVRHVAVPDEESGDDLAEECVVHAGDRDFRSEEHTSELQSLMRISYAVFCLKKKTKSEY